MDFEEQQILGSDEEEGGSWQGRGGERKEGELRRQSGGVVLVLVLVLVGIVVVVVVVVVVVLVVVLVVILVVVLV